jgi:hypothetical protein
MKITFSIKVDLIVTTNIFVNKVKTYLSLPPVGDGNGGRRGEHDDGLGQCYKTFFFAYPKRGALERCFSRECSGLTLAYFDPCQ